LRRGSAWHGRNALAGDETGTANKGTANKKGSPQAAFFVSLQNSDQRPFERSLAMAASWAIAAASSACALA
jgi:hypothetical protein